MATSPEALAAALGPERELLPVTPGLYVGAETGLWVRADEIVTHQDGGGRIVLYVNGEGKRWMAEPEFRRRFRPAPVLPVPDKGGRYRHWALPGVIHTVTWVDQWGIGYDLSVGTYRPYGLGTQSIESFRREYVRLPDAPAAQELQP